MLPSKERSNMANPRVVVNLFAHDLIVSSPFCACDLFSFVSFFLWGGRVIARFFFSISLREVVSFSRIDVLFALDFACKPTPFIVFTVVLQIPGTHPGVHPSPVISILPIPATHHPPEISKRVLTRRLPVLWCICPSPVKTHG